MRPISRILGKHMVGDGTIDCMLCSRSRRCDSTYKWNKARHHTQYSAQHQHPNTNETLVLIIATITSSPTSEVGQRPPAFKFFSGLM